MLSLAGADRGVCIGEKGRWRYRLMTSALVAVLEVLGFDDPFCSASDVAYDEIELTSGLAKAFAPHLPGSQHGGVCPACELED